MNEKVKLPRNVIDTFRPALDSPHYKRLGSLTPIGIISNIYNRTLKDVTNDVANWLNDYDNQWKLIDALRYGYESESEPRWGIKAGNCYMDASDSWGFDNVTPKAVIDNEAYWMIKKAADEIVRVLGFGEVVDLNKEGKTDEAESEQLYYVQFIKNDGYSFLNSSDSDGLEISDNEETEYIKTKFTMPEIEAIDPRYKTFAVPVEDGDQDEN